MEPNPYAPPADASAPVDGPSTGGLSIVARIVQGVLLSLVLAIAGFMFLGMMVSAAKHGGPAGLWRQLETRNSSRGGFAGAALVYILSMVWAPVSTVWSLINLIGLLSHGRAGAGAPPLDGSTQAASRGRWLFGSLVAFWLVNILTCLCSPFGLVGLIHILIAGRATPATTPVSPAQPWQSPPL